MSLYRVGHTLLEENKYPLTGGMDTVQRESHVLENVSFHYASVFFKEEVILFWSNLSPII